MLVFNEYLSYSELRKKQLDNTMPRRHSYMLRNAFVSRGARRARAPRAKQHNNSKRDGQHTETNSIRWCAGDILYFQMCLKTLGVTEKRLARSHVRTQVLYLSACSCFALRAARAARKAWQVAASCLASICKLLFPKPMTCCRAHSCPSVFLWTKCFTV